MHIDKENDVLGSLQHHLVWTQSGLGTDGLSQRTWGAAAAGVPLNSIAGRTITLGLNRKDYRGAGALAYVPTCDFRTVLPWARTFLHAREIGIFQEYSMEKRRISYLLGRFAGKSALQHCVDGVFNPSSVSIESGVFCQPVVQGANISPCGLSISHSDKWACSIAYPDVHPMAIDVEEINPEKSGVMLTQIKREEFQQALTLGMSADLAATLLWTAKEALSKVLRSGMTCPFELLETTQLQKGDTGWEGRFKNFTQYKFQSWRHQTTLFTIVLPWRTELEIRFPEGPPLVVP